MRNDGIPFQDTIHTAELAKYLIFDTSVDKGTRIAITSILTEFWDFFVKEGAKRTTLGYEFDIDTGGSKPFCCRKPSYGPYESKVIMDQITQLLGNKWIDRCGRPWGSMIFLAQKPHQENINNIDDFIWRMCILYCRLSSITKPFQFPIPRCDNAVIVLEDGVGNVLIIKFGCTPGLSSNICRRS